MKGLVIFGIGQIGEAIHYYFTEESDRKVVAFTADAAYCTVDTLLGVPVVPFEEVEVSYPPDTHELFVAMGYGQVNKARDSWRAARRMLISAVNSTT